MTNIHVPRLGFPMEEKIEANATDKYNRAMRILSPKLSNVCIRASFVKEALALKAMSGSKIRKYHFLTSAQVL